MKLLDTLGKTKKAIGGVVAILLVCVLIFFAGMHFGGKESEPVITSTALTQQLQEVNELVSMEYHYTKVGKFENSLQINGWNIPLTTKSFLLTYSGKLSAGIDLSKAYVSVKDKVITVQIPEVEIFANIIDEKSIEVYDESKNIFNPISVNDYKTFATQQKDLVEEEAIENGFLSEAATKAQSAIRKFLQMVPEVKDQYTIEVVFQESE